MKYPAANSPLFGSDESHSADMIGLLRGHAMQDGGQRTAFIFLGDGETETDRLTYRELDRRARALAVHLLAATEGAQRALLLYPPGLDFITALFGCLYAGIVAVPANPPSRQHLHRLRSVVEDADPAIVMTTAALRDQLETRSGQSWHRDDLPWLVTDGLDLAASDRWSAPPLSSDSLAFLQYTSGSTGAPKGVMISHGNLLSNEAAIRDAFGHGATSIVVGWLPLYHDMGLIGTVLQPIFVGSTAILMPPLAFLERPLRWLMAITKYRAHTSGGPNFAYELCLRHIADQDKPGLDLSSWTVAFNGSETVRASTLARFATAFAPHGFQPEAFYPCYGMAEATLFVSGPERGRVPVIGRFDKVALTQGLAVVETDPTNRNEGIVACGHGWNGHRVEIVDPESLCPCPESRIGEIWVAGPSIAQGYWRQPDQTESSFRASISDEGGDLFLRTGDLGFIAGGELFITGRIKDLIIVRGANYHASDFERVLDQDVPGLRPGCNTAFAVDRANEEALILVAEVKRDYFRAHGATPIFQAVRAAVAHECGLAIGEIVLVPPGGVSKTTSGKIRRRACRQAYLEGELHVLATSGTEPAALAVGADETRTKRARAASAYDEFGKVEEIERVLRAQVARILRCSDAEIPTGTSLLELGLDSLQIVALKHGLDAVFQVDLPLEILLTDKGSRATAEEISFLPARHDVPPPSGATGLSYTQHALWTVHGLDRDSISSNLHFALDVAGMLDIERLRTALAHVLQRYDQLRTVYRVEKASLGQVAAPLSELPEWFSLVDAGNWDAGMLQADMERRVRRPFDLEQGPPLWIVAYRKTEGPTTLLFCAHHIAVDFWSLLVLLRDLDQSYREPRSLPASAALPVYADFVAWQQRYLESPLAASDLEYWRGQLDRALPVLALPVDFPRPAVSNFGGASETLRVGPDLTAALKRLAAGRGVSLSTLLLAAYQVLLYRYTGQSEIVVGVPASGRVDGAFAGVVGNCVNPIALVGHPCATSPFVEFLRQLGECVHDALVHQNFPFPLLVERMRPDRQDDQWPIYQTFFVLQQAQADISPDMAFLALGEEGAPFSWCNCSARVHALQNRVENFDLKLMAAMSEGGLVLSFQYRTELFRPATIAHMADHFATLLDGIVAAPETRIGDLPLLPEVERQRLRAEWNATSADRRDACVHELFVAQATLTPDAIAVSFDGRQLTYAELDERTDDLARYLRDHGVRADVVVALCVERSLELVIGILGILKAGGAYLPLDPDYPMDRLAYMLADAGPRLILTQAHLESLLPRGVGIVRLDQDRHLFTGLDRGARPFRNLPLDLAYVIYTSGSTGRPKGVAVTHGGLVNRLDWMVAYFGVCGKDVVLQKTPYGFDVSAWEILLPLLVGGRLVIARPGDHQDPARLASVIEREQVTIVHFVPSMLRAFLDAPSLPPFPTLRHVICSGEALSPQVADRFHSVQRAALHNLYGPTEASIDVTAHSCERGRREVNIAIGRPVWNTQIYILDSNVDLVPVGVAGELYIGGVGLARGYLGRSDMTAERFVPDPFGGEGGRMYRTGDLARYRADGTIVYLGRIDHQVKLRGFRIELGEIEARLSEHRDVHAAVVTMREVGTRMHLVAYVVGHADATRNPEVLRDWLRHALPDSMIPTFVVWLDALPLTLNGKIDRKALPAPESPQGTADHEPPRTPAEERLAAIWSDLLGVDQVGTNDNFFLLGGDSILSIQMASRVRAAGFDLAPRLVFLHPTVGALAPLLRRIVADGSDSSTLSAAPFALAESTPEEVDRLRMEFADLADLYPLTPLQEGMLFHCLLQPGSGVYVLQDQYEIHGKVDVEAFRAAWQELVDRHDILRSAILWRQIAKPHQRVQRHAPLPFWFEDWRDRSPEEQDKRLDEILAVEQRDGIDLEKPPLMRIRLYRLGEDRWRCLRSHHHILTDEWCTSPLFLEFREAYAALCGSHASPERHAHRFRDYIGWLKQQDLAASEAFWRPYLKGFREPTPLVVDRMRGGRSTGTAVVKDAQAALGPESTLALHEAARSHGVTPNTLVQAAFALLLGRYANRTEVVFGITVSGRPAELPGIEQTLGLFINTLPLRLRLPDGQSVCDWWRDIQALNLDLRQFEHTSLVQCQAWSEIPRGVDLFRHLLVYENAPVDQSLLTDRSVIDMRFIGNRVHTNYPITLTIIPGERLAVRMTYQAARFEVIRIERMLAHFLGLLESMIARPHACLGELGLLGPVERRQHVSDWNRTEHAFAPPADFVAAFETQVASSPDAPAVRCGATSLRYDELNRRVNRAAHGLIARGIGPEAIVAVIDERGVDFLVMMLAVLKAGGVYLPLDPRHPRRRHLDIIEASGAVAVLGGEAWLRGFKHYRGGGEAIFVALSDIEQVPSEQNPSLRAGPRNLAYIISTSGSTGAPKGAMVERAGMYNNLMTKIPALGLDRRDRIAQTASQGFDISVWQFLTALICGACVDIVPDVVTQDPRALLGALGERGITIFESVPTMIGALLETPRDIPLALRWLLPTGEALPPDLCHAWFARFPGVPMLNAYGPAECADDVAYHRIDGAPETEALVTPIGRPVANIRLYILDRRLEPVPVGVPGELCVAGIGVGRGYVRRPDLTAASFLPDPFGSPGERLYRTGDLARFLEGGTIEFLGRIDHQVKIRGHRIEIGEIEARLGRHPELREAAVKAWPDARLGLRLVGYFSPWARGAMQAEALRHYLRDRLPDYMVPGLWIECAALPRNPNGKLDRNALLPPAEFEPTARFEAPATPTEEILAGLWGGVLGRDRIGRRDNFFELGGHSLLATQAIARIDQAFGIEMPLRALFESPSVAELAVRVDSTRLRLCQSTRPVRAPAPRDENLPLSHAQQRLWFMHQMDPSNSLYHFVVAVRVTGPFNAEAFHESLNAIVRRHESLRTIFREEDGRVHQHILPELRVRLDREEVEIDTAEACTNELLRRMRDVIAAPFDLATGPLLRASLYRLRPADDGPPACAILLCFHHIVFDGWSFGVFLKEFAALYPMIGKGAEPALPPLPLQYADYAVWQRAHLQNETLTCDLDYWTAQLKGAPPVLDLPVDRPRNSRTGDAAASHRLDLDDSRSAFGDFNRQHAVTPFMTMLAAFAGLLRYLSGAADLVIGADVANRQCAEFEPLIGFFINLVALRINLDGNLTFAEILARIRSVTLGAYEHQDLPFEKLVEALRPERGSPHAAIFQVKLVFHNVPLAELDLPGLRFEAIPFEVARTELDLVLHVYEGRQGFHVVFEYRKGLFEVATITRFADLFRALLNRVLVEPGLGMKALQDLLAETDRTIQTAARAKQSAARLGRLQLAKRKDVRGGS